MNSAYDGMPCILAFHISTRQGDNELEEEKYAYAFCPCWWWWHNGDCDYAAASFFLQIASLHSNSLFFGNPHNDR